jgi:hypothetical protein
MYDIQILIYRGYQGSSALLTEMGLYEFNSAAHAIRSISRVMTHSSRSGVKAQMSYLASRNFSFVSVVGLAPYVFISIVVALLSRPLPFLPPHLYLNQIHQFNYALRKGFAATPARDRPIEFPHSAQLCRSVRRSTETANERI